MQRLRRILVPVDFTDGSVAALRHASALARILGSHLHVIHIAAEPQMPAWAAEPSGRGRAAAWPPDHPSALDRLASLIATARLDPLTITGVLRVGCPEREIAGYADEINADLIVMGVHGDHLARPGTVGSVIEAVLTAVRCPVMAIPQTQADVVTLRRSRRQRVAC